MFKPLILSLVIVSLSAPSLAARHRTPPRVPSPQDRPVTAPGLELPDSAFWAGHYDEYASWDELKQHLASPATEVFMVPVKTDNPEFTQDKRDIETKVEKPSTWLPYWCVFMIIGAMLYMLVSEIIRRRR